MSSISTKYHTTLSNYFAAQPLFFDGELQKQPHVRKCMEQPWQQTKGKLWGEVTETLCDLNFIQAKACAKQTYDLVKDYHSAQDGLPEYQPEKEKEHKRQERMEKYTRDLIACAKGKITRFELEVPESITPWTQEQIDAEIERIKTNPNRADRLKDFMHFLGREADNLQKYASEFAFFSHQQAWNYVADGVVGKAAEKLSIINSKFLLRRITNTRPPWNPYPQVLISLIGHTSPVKDVAITPDGKRAISGSNDNTCILWDLESGKALQTLKGHSVKAVAITPDGKKAISVSKDKTCILWDLVTGKALKTQTLGNKFVTAITITPDGNLAIYGSRDTIYIWDLKRGKALQTLKGHSFRVNAMAITPDGNLAISGSDDKTCILWDLKRGKALQKLKGHSSPVRAVTITPSGKLAISGSDDKTCILWDLGGGRSLKILNGHAFYVNAVVVTADGKQAFSGSEDGTCILWDLGSGRSLKTQMGHIEQVTVVTVTPDGKLAISGSVDNTCILWDLGNWKSLKTLKGHTDFVHSVAVTPSGKQAISSSFDKTCILWDLASGKSLKTLKGHTDLVFSVAVTPNGKQAISSSFDKTCILWNLASGRSLKTLTGHTESVFSMAVTPDGKMAISGSDDNSCILWDLASGRTLKTLTGHTESVHSVAVTPDGKQAISGSYDNTCILWDLASGRTLKTLTGHTESVESVAVTPDGKMAISGSDDNSCILWDLQNGKALAKYVTESSICSVSIFSKNILLGCASGEVLVLKIQEELLFADIVNTTIRQIWDFEFKKYQPLSADCPLCGNRFAPPSTVLTTITEITKKAGLKPEQSPCLELPKEAWEQAGLLGECPSCKEKLKFNPFIAGGLDKKPEQTKETVNNNIENLEPNNPIESLIEKGKFQLALGLLENIKSPNGMEMNAKGVCFLKLNILDKALEQFLLVTRKGTFGWKEDAKIEYKRNLLVTFLLMKRIDAYQAALNDIEKSEKIDNSVQRIIDAYYKWEAEITKEVAKVSFFKRSKRKAELLKNKPITFDFEIGELYF